MKIDSVSGMNFSPVSMREHQGAAKVAAPEQKMQVAANTSLSHNGLTSAESAFFAKLFPDLSQQGNTNSTYSPSGIRSAVEPGQIINRKV